MANILLPAALIIIMTEYAVLDNSYYAESRQTDLSFPFSNETHISCDTNRRIRVNNVSVVDDVQCLLDDIGDIKNSCDGKDSCSVRTNSTSGCLVEYGNFNISYICRGANYDCNFEIGYCGWLQDKSDDFDWIIQKANLDAQVPSTDHTTGSQFGHLLHSGVSAFNKKARIISNIIVSNNNLCLTFWYQILGTWRTGNLYVYQQIGNQLQTPVDTITTRTGNIWVKKEIELKYLPSFRIVIESIQGDSGSSVAVDDIYIRDGNCSGSSFDCTFDDNNLCNWNIEFEKLMWLIQRPNNNQPPYYPYFDHTTGSGDGRYLHVFVYTKQQQKGTMKLVRNVTDLTMDTCLTFWYNILFNDSGTLRVALRFNGIYKTLWTTSSETSQQWSSANIDIAASDINSITFIVIECVLADYNIFGIDDIGMRRGKCSGDKIYKRRYNSTLDILHVNDCPKQLLEVGNLSFNYYPKYSECEDVYKQAQMMAMESCSNFNVSDTEYCNISLSAIKDKNIHCFILPKNISVNYTCQESASISFGEEERFKIIGISVGAGSALLVLIITIVCIGKRRTRHVNKKKHKTNTPKHDSDIYDATSGKQRSVKHEDVEVVYYNEQYPEQSNFMTISNVKDGLDNPIHLGITKEISNDIVYYNLDTKVMNKMSKQSKPDIQNPEIEKMTDFNTDNIEDVYDRTNSIRLKREQHNVYSHAVDDVYDSASQTKNLTREEDVSYDHFVGGTPECNYSVVHKKPKNKCN